jgi:hypothetical protein
VVVAGIVMFNILELIMEIVPNYPTTTLRMISIRSGQHFVKPLREPENKKQLQCSIGV